MVSEARRQTRANGARTKVKILDAAELLFGARGFDGVSLRDITDEAGVTLALASYHFGTKESLFEEVVARRAAVLGEGRLKRLEALDAAGVRDILDAFLAPLFEKAGSRDPGWPAYFRVLARLGEGTQWLDLLHRYFDPVGQRFIDALLAAAPGADRAAVSRGFALMLHAMLAVASQNGRVSTLTGGAVRADDLDAAYAALLDFSTAGMQALMP
ncbi:MAG: TetR family transcriptional regulator [Maritimibacter sp.]|nr:TetR family transcriptional regulator [Maritimibacter sp.]